MDLVKDRQLLVLGGVPTLSPALDLARGEALGPAKISKANNLGVDQMEIRQRVD
jgi:hypothetical protein